MSGTAGVVFQQRTKSLREHVPESLCRRYVVPAPARPGASGSTASGVAPAVSLWTVRSLTVCATARAAVRGVYTPTPLLVL